MFAAKPRVNALGGNLLEGRQTGLDYDVTSLSAVNFNTGIAEAENADVILLVGTNLRWEAPLINTRVRKAVWKKGAKVFAIGPETDLTYKTEWLGDDARSEEHTSELQSLMRISYAVFCLKKKTQHTNSTT